MTEVDIGDGQAPIGDLEGAGRTQILSLSGGGYRGLYSAQFLALCEAHYKVKSVERFQLIAGTSIGALIAAGIACGVGADQLVEKFTHHGPKIFPKSKIKDIKKAFIQAPYEAEPVRNAIVDTLGKTLAGTPLRDIPARLMIVAVNYSTGSPAIFTSGGLHGAKASSVALVDAILASAAAPTFFPEKKIGKQDYIDGGVLANAPDLLAFNEARRSMAIETEQLFMLSIGTAGRIQGGALKPDEKRPGGVSWIVGRKLVQAIMASQEVLAVEQTKAFLGDRHVRVDQEPPAEQEKAIADLDQADDAATQALMALAQTSWDRLGATRHIRDFFDVS